MDKQVFLFLPSFHRLHGWRQPDAPDSLRCDNDPGRHIISKDDVAPGEVKVWLNVVEQGQGLHPGQPLLFPQPVDFEPVPSTRVLEFHVDPSLLKQINSLTFSSTREVQGDCIYIAVKYGG